MVTQPSGTDSAEAISYNMIVLCQWRLQISWNTPQLLLLLPDEAALLEYLSKQWMLTIVIICCPGVSCSKSWIKYALQIKYLLNNNQDALFRILSLSQGFSGVLNQDEDWYKSVVTLSDHLIIRISSISPISLTIHFLLSDCGSDVINLTLVMKLVCSGKYWSENCGKIIVVWFVRNN